MKITDNIEHYNWELLAKYLCHEASDEERLAVETWANQSGHNLTALNESRELLEKAKLWFETERFDAETAWQKVNEQTDITAPVVPLSGRPVKSVIFSRFWRVAAAVIVAVSLSTAGYYIGFRQPQAYVLSEIITNDRQVVKGIVLPDGSVVTLNQNSKLTYPKTFNGGTREVDITGEAFFEVVPDASRPFIIHAGNAKIKVLGTSFNVCAYPGDATVDVVVETGKVEVTCNTPGVSANCNAILIPGEKGTLSMKEFTVSKSVNSDRNVSAWRTRQFIFDQTPLPEVVAALEKVYFVEIQLVDPALNNLVLTANFNDQPIDFILDVIRLTFNLELKSMNGQYFLTTTGIK